MTFSPLRRVGLAALILMPLSTWLACGSGGGGSSTPPAYVAPACADVRVGEKDDYPSDAWPACVSDDGDYHPLSDSISTLARVAAYEEIRSLLFDPEGAPSEAEFRQARLIYQEEEGLDSRVVRRYDSHFQPAAKVDCTNDVGPLEHPDFCVGPAQIQPLILDALRAGAEGKEPTHNAARVEAGLLWFLKVSVFKESVTCAEKAQDCDSAYGYYTGGAAQEEGLGLAGEVLRVGKAAHGATWDGLLAVRCWRDLDSGPVAADHELAARARAQLDRGLEWGLADVLEDRLTKMQRPSESAYQWAFSVALSRAFLAAERDRAPSATTALRALGASESPEAVDVSAVEEALEAIRACDGD